MYVNIERRYVLLQVLSNYEVLSALLIMGGGLLVVSYQQDNSESGPQEDFRRKRAIAETRRRLEEGTANKRN